MATEQNNENKFEKSEFLQREQQQNVSIREEIWMKFLLRISMWRGANFGHITRSEDPRVAIYSHYAPIVKKTHQSSSLILSIRDLSLVSAFAIFFSHCSIYSFKILWQHVGPTVRLFGQQFTLATFLVEVTINLELSTGSLRKFSVNFVIHVTFGHCF